MNLIFLSHTQSVFMMSMLIFTFQDLTNMARYHLEPHYVILCLKSKIFSLKNNKLFQACIPLALVLTFFCTPVFSLNSVDDFGTKFTVHFVGDEYAGFPLENCFGVFGSFSRCISGVQNGSLVIEFSNPVDMTNFTIDDVYSPYQFVIDGVYYDFDKFVNFSNIENISAFTLMPFPNEYLWINSVTFDFEYVNTGTGGTGDGFRCEGFSCWFLTEESYKDVWLALMSFMVSIFLLAYIGKIIRTGGAS